MQRCLYLDDSMKKLKISDLSVGDWVRWNDKTYRVCVIDGVSLTVELAEELGGTIEVAIDEVSGIPITPEILEKHGFIKNRGYNEWNIGEWNERPFIGVSLDRQSMRVKFFCTDIFIENKVVYVHQLQHALRLAGIEKDIEL